jgi:hypothetical protein
VPRPTPANRHRFPEFLFQFSAQTIPISGNESALKTFSCRHRERAMLLSRGDRQSREHLLKTEVSFVWFAVPIKKRHTGITDQRHGSILEGVLPFLNLAEEITTGRAYLHSDAIS